MEEKLIEENRGLVKSIVYQFYPKNHNEYDELEQAGLIGLMKAIRNHNPARGKLSTVAFYYISGEIKRFLKKERESTESEIQYPLLYAKSYSNINEYLDNLTNNEQIIIDMKLAGFTFSEISEKLKCSTTWTYESYKKLLDRIALINE